jgi:hypothetical protein
LFSRVFENNPHFNNMKRQFSVSELSRPVQVQNRRRVAFEELSSPLLILNHRGIVVDVNDAALALPDEALDAATSIDRDSQGIGDLLNCVNAGAGCGGSSACSLCGIRQSINKASSGETVRAATTVRVQRNGGQSKIDFRVTANPLAGAQEALVVVMLEDQALWSL